MEQVSKTFIPCVSWRTCTDPTSMGDVPGTWRADEWRRTATARHIGARHRVMACATHWCPSSAMHRVEPRPLVSGGAYMVGCPRVRSAMACTDARRTAPPPFGGIQHCQHCLLCAILMHPLPLMAGLRSCRFAKTGSTFKSRSRQHAVPPCDSETAPKRLSTATRTEATLTGNKQHDVMARNWRRTTCARIHDKGIE